MPITDHPNVFRFEGRTWVSEEPREEAHARLVDQRRWDAATTRAQRWWVAIVIGAVVAVGAVLWVSTATGAPGVLYLFTLPIAFALGAVLGAMVNKRINPGSTQQLGERPTIPELVRVPGSVLRRLDNITPAADIIRQSRGGR